MRIDPAKYWNCGKIAGPLRLARYSGYEGGFGPSASVRISGSANPTYATAAYSPACPASEHAHEPHLAARLLHRDGSHRITDYPADLCVSGGNGHCRDRRLILSGGHSEPLDDACLRPAPVDGYRLGKRAWRRTESRVGTGARRWRRRTDDVGPARSEER